MSVDGIISAESRWSGAKTSEQWMLVDLGKIVEASEIIIHFESECPDYEVQVSKDGKNFTTIYSDRMLVNEILFQNKFHLINKKFAM